MIKDEKQYDFTKEQAQKFERTIAQLHQDEEKKKNDPDYWQLYHDSLQGILETLRE
ncbi:MAG: hypothetical protein GDA56_19750 [Hormoscilla sp. GM7CHS1pb]|nr:hypothetical protein [Hormoscilla sp. GM7CHS1pb]